MRFELFPKRISFQFLFRKSISGKVLYEPFIAFTKSVLIDISAKIIDIIAFK